MALRLDKTVGGSADLWLRRQVSYDLAKVRGREREISMVQLAPGGGVAVPPDSPRLPYT